MFTFYLIIVFILGLIVGSFLNVCIYRIPIKGLSINFPRRSFCPRCLTYIRWYDNIPILSFLLLKGRCRHCKCAIPLRYSTVELLSGLIFVVLFWLILNKYNLDFNRHFSSILPFFFVQAFICSMLLIATFIDIDYRIIPNEITYTGIIIGIITSYLPGMQWDVSGRITMLISPLLSWFIGVVVGGGLIYFIGVFGKIIFRKEAMGFGDVKLLAMIGGFYGWRCSVVVLFTACLFGAVCGIINWLSTRDRYIPFGPFIALACFATIFFKDFFYYYSARPDKIFYIFFPQVV